MFNTLRSTRPLRLVVRFVHDRQRRIRRLGRLDHLFATDHRAIVVVIRRRRDRALLEPPTHGQRWRGNVRQHGGARRNHPDDLLHRHRNLLLLLHLLGHRRRLHVLLLLLQKLFQLQKVAQLELLVLNVLALEQKLKLLA